MLPADCVYILLHDQTEGGLRVVDTGYSNTAVISSRITYIDGRLYFTRAYRSPMLNMALSTFRQARMESFVTGGSLFLLNAKMHVPNQAEKTRLRLAWKAIAFGSMTMGRRI